jgi:hypothetical protein
MPLNAGFQVLSQREGDRLAGERKLRFAGRALDAPVRIGVFPVRPSSPPRPGAAIEVVGSTGSIPKDHFQPCSLFLVCNPKWLTSDMDADLYRLY